MNPSEIICLANQIKTEYRSKDPFFIAANLGIRVLIRTMNTKSFKAQTIKADQYPTIISINQNFTPLSRQVLCAHELGHALLHEDFINHFNVNSKNIHTNVEYEANLFAVALLFNERDFSMPLDKMSNSVLKSILDYNIK